MPAAEEMFSPIAVYSNFSANIAKRTNNQSDWNKNTKKKEEK